MQRPLPSIMIPILLLAVVTQAMAMWARPDDPVPLDRLLRNVGDYVNKNPKDARGHYVLGRLYSLAFAQGMHRVNWMYNTKSDPIAKRDQLPQFGPIELYYKRDPKAPKPDEVALEHLRKSVQHYWHATRLADKEALYWLGLGWVLEQADLFNVEVAEPAPLKGTMSRIVLDLKKPLTPHQRSSMTLNSYRKAYRVALPGDTESEHFGPGVHEAISVESGEAIIRLLKRKPRHSAPELREIESITKAIAPIKKKGRAITPIIFPLNRQKTLAELLDPYNRVSFDLAGDQVARRWPWLRPGAGIIVWDPHRTGRITSGRQLFGSVTWWMFWQNGYEPLSALDDDKDGWLTGGELNGIAVWHDRNCNGISDPGEVESLKSHGIAGIATGWTHSSDASLSNARGIRRNDGTYVPTYDWIPHSIAYSTPKK